MKNKNDYSIYMIIPEYSCSGLWEVLPNNETENHCPIEFKDLPFELHPTIRKKIHYMNEVYESFTNIYDQKNLKDLELDESIFNKMVLYIYEDLEKYHKDIFFKFYVPDYLQKEWLLHKKRILSEILDETIDTIDEKKDKQIKNKI